MARKNKSFWQFLAVTLFAGFPLIAGDLESSEKRSSTEIAPPVSALDQHPIHTMGFIRVSADFPNCEFPPALQSIQIFAQVDEADPFIVGTLSRNSHVDMERWTVGTLHGIISSKTVSFTYLPTGNDGTCPKSPYPLTVSPAVRENSPRYGEAPPPLNKAGSSILPLLREHGSETKYLEAVRISFARNPSSEFNLRASLLDKYLCLGESSPPFLLTTRPIGQLGSPENDRELLVKVISSLKPSSFLTSRGGYYPPSSLQQDDPSSQSRIPPDQILTAMLTYAVYAAQTYGVTINLVLVVQLFSAEGYFQSTQEEEMLRKLLDLLKASTLHQSKKTSLRTTNE